MGFTLKWDCSNVGDYATLLRGHYRGHGKLCISRPSRESLLLTKKVAVAANRPHRRRHRLMYARYFCTCYTIRDRVGYKISKIIIVSRCRERSTRRQSYVATLKPVFTAHGASRDVISICARLSVNDAIILGLRVYPQYDAPRSYES